MGGPSASVFGGKHAGPGLERVEDTLTMVKPTIHRNGSDAKQLQDGYEEAGHAVWKAMEAVRATYPNGRDYYPQGETAITVAMRECDARLAKLKEVYDELSALMEHVADADK